MANETTIKCDMCNGHGVVFCFCPGALGKVVNSWGDTVDCQVCNGTGDRECKNCKGTGELVIETPAPNGGETAAMPNQWPVILHNGVTHAVLATGGPADGSLYGMFTFCNLEVLDNQEDPDWREVNNGQVTCEICKIGMTHEQKENKRLEREVHEHVADYIAKNVDALSDLKTTPEPPATARKLSSVKLTEAQVRIADKLASGWTVHSPIENCMATWRRPGGFPTPDACNISSLKAMKQRGLVTWEDGQWTLTPAGVAALAARESEAGK